MDSMVVGTLAALPFHPMWAGSAADVLYPLGVPRPACCSSSSTSCLLSAVSSGVWTLDVYPQTDSFFALLFPRLLERLGLWLICYGISWNVMMLPCCVNVV